MMMPRSVSTNTVLLETLLKDLADCTSCQGIEISGISNDSRKIKKGNLFLACHGATSSGIRYIRDAINAGAVAVAAEKESEAGVFVSDVPVVYIRGLRDQAGIIADRFYNHPSRRLDVIGVTGTNGKTSITWFIAQALCGISGKKTGVIGTLGTGEITRLRPGLNTTPDPVTIHETLHDFEQDGIQTAVIEVTSIGLDQGRVSGVDFDIGVFTNLSVDHLDYHGDIDAYAKVKKLLFTSHGIKHAVINSDDEFGNKLIHEIKDSMHVIAYRLVESFSDNEPVTQETISAAVDESGVGLKLHIRSPWGESRLNSSLNGRYNAYNLLASLGCLCLLNIPFDEAIDRLSKIIPVPGRLEKFTGNNTPAIYVDYAHTPDALEKVLVFLRSQSDEKLVCVFGCGGNRDTSKRSKMGAIAERYADEVIITNDNPRAEEPENIINDILAGIKDKNSVVVEPDRNKAIIRAIAGAGVKDTVLIAGKGHETYQEIAGRRIPFSDRQLVRNILDGFS